MKENPDDPGSPQIESGFPPGISAEDAKEYLFRHIAALKIAEKAREETAGEYQKWLKRAELAESRAAADLIEAARGETVRLQARYDTLNVEITELEELIAALRRQLPGLAARERNIDPDLLEQELRIVLGEDPGEGPTAATLDRRFEEMNADAALEALKRKMGESST
jgi:hypothetical protein